MKKILSAINQFAFVYDETENQRFYKNLILIVAFSCAVCGVFWSLMYFFLMGAGFTMLVPLFFVVIVGFAIPIAHVKRNSKILVYAQLYCITFISALLQWSIGSIDDSGFVIFWSFLGPIGALLFLKGKQTYGWFALFICMVLITVLIHPKLTNDAVNLSKNGRVIFYIMNISIPAFVIFAALRFFILSNDENLEKVKKTFTLLIMSEKLATLGQISAGVAHEVNTPLGAIKSSAEESSKAFAETVVDFQWLAKALNDEDKKMFFEFLRNSKTDRITLSTIEEREIKKKLRSQFDELGVINSRFVSDRLVQVGVCEINPTLEKIIHHEHFEKLMMIAYNVLNQQRSNQNIQLAVDKASRIVNALKTYVHSSTNNETESVDLRSNIETVLTIYHNRFKQGIDIIKNYEEVPEIQGHPDELNQIWTNLIVNAIQAMDNKGTLTIGIKRDADFVTVSISDTGIGMSTDVQEKIFTPFFTTKSSGEGSGLGLDIVKRIVEDHHASISFESEEGKGTTFYVKIPVKK